MGGGRWKWEACRYQDVDLLQVNLHYRWETQVIQACITLLGASSLFVVVVENEYAVLPNLLTSHQSESYQSEPCCWSPPPPCFSSGSEESRKRKTRRKTCFLTSSSGSIMTMTAGPGFLSWWYDTYLTVPPSRWKKESRKKINSFISRIMSTLGLVCRVAILGMNGCWILVQRLAQIWH